MVSVDQNNTRRRYFTEQKSTCLGQLGRGKAIILDVLQIKVKYLHLLFWSGQIVVDSAKVCNTGRLI